MAILISVQMPDSSVIFDQKALLKMLIVGAALVVCMIIGFLGLAWGILFAAHLALNLLFEAFVEADHAGLLMQSCLLFVVSSMLCRAGKLVARAVRSFRSW
jgi:hypothetical protein